MVLQPRFTCNSGVIPAIVGQEEQSPPQGINYLMVADEKSSVRAVVTATRIRCSSGEALAISAKVRR